MSDPWAINAGKANTAIGTATIASATNLLTIAGHGLGDGDTVTVDTLTGGGSVLTADAVYFVRDATTDDFALSLSLHGPQVEFATDGGADVYHFAPQYTAAELRRLNAGLMFGGVTEAFGAREGVRPGYPPVSVSGTTWTVEDLTGTVFPGLSSSDGPYAVAHQEESGSLDPADGSNDRIDAIDLQIQDDDTDASGFRRVRAVYVAGTPAASPSEPSLTSNSLRLGTFDVFAGGSPSPAVRSLAQYTVASGGVLPVRDDTEGPDAGRYQGMLRYRQDIDQLEVWDGAAWVPLATPKGWTHIDAGSTAAVGEVSVDLTGGGRFPANTFSRFRFSADGFGDGQITLGMRLNNDTGNNYDRSMAVLDVVTDDWDQVNGGQNTNQWICGYWTNYQYCNFEATIFVRGNVEQSMQFRASAPGAGNFAAFGGGGYDENIHPTSLQFRVAGGAGTVFSGINWQVEGYRI